EDHHFARLMLDEAQAARLDRLWDELHYVSHDALTLVDAFEQLWQYATQDADPKVFEPMREPIKQRAAAFRQRLGDTQPAHLDALAAQTRRMLRDPRVRRLATEFACAWLQIYDFDELGEKSERHFPTFAGLRGAMYEETIRFFTDLFQRDASVLDILDADYT